MTPIRLTVLALVISLTTGCITNQQAYESPLLRALSGQSEKKVEGIAAVNVDIGQYDVANLAPGQRPARGTLEDGLWLQAEKAESILKTGGNRVREEAINRYIRGIVCKLALEYCGDVRAYVVHMPDFNATMSPNGMMQIWTGLLLRVRNEAQLAAVLGHEIGHYLRRHGLQRIDSANQKLNALIFVQLAAAFAGVPAVGDVASLIAQGSITSFSRNNEREADGYGIVLLSQAGYDPREASKVWDALIKETEARKGIHGYSIFNATHPQPEERREVLKALAETAIAKLRNGDPGDTGRDRFLEAVLPIRAKLLRDEIRMGRFDQTKVLFESLLEDGANPAEIHYFTGELYRLRRNDGDQEKAVEAYQKALDIGDPPAEAYRALGLIHRKLGNKNRSATYLSRYIQLAPNAKDRSMIEEMLRGGS